MAALDGVTSRSRWSMSWIFAVTVAVAVPPACRSTGTSSAPSAQQDSPSAEEDEEDEEDTGLLSVAFDVDTSQPIGLEGVEMLAGVTVVSATHLYSRPTNCLYLDDNEVDRTMREQVDFGETVIFEAPIGWYCVYGGGSHDYSSSSSLYCSNRSDPVLVYKGVKTELSLIAECVGFEEG